MSYKKNGIFFGSSLLLFQICLFSYSCKPQKTSFITVGTGGITGVYYPTGGAICKLVNKKKEIYDMRCTFESTGGSVFNINAVLSGDLEFGITQSDRQYQAFHGLSDWKDKGPQLNLRSVFSIHSESVTLLAAVDAGIREVANLKGKKVNLGNPGSGQRQNAIDALKFSGLDYKKDIYAEFVKGAEAPGLLQDGRIDAFFYTVGHPSGAISEAGAGRRKVRIVPIIVDEKFLKKYPYYTVSTIPIANYTGLDNKFNVNTFGVKATLVTSKNISEAIVYNVTKEVFENFSEFKKLHPSFETLTKADMLKGLTAPLHPGAIKYFKEAGLLK